MDTEHADRVGVVPNPELCHMALGYQKRLFLLAFDHGASFEKVSAATGGGVAPASSRHH